MLNRIVFVALFAACAVTACIFDSGGDYTGGGRRNVGAELDQGEEEPEEDTGSSGSGGEDSGGNPFADALGGGGD